MDKQMTAKSEILKKLFFSTFYLSAFTFGGGYVIINEVNAGIPYISTTLSTDVTAAVKTKLGLK